MKFNKLFSIAILSSSLISSSLFLASCSNVNAFYFANFESYMSPELTSEIKSKYSNVNFRYFSTNEDLERSFVRNFDLTVASAYLVAKQVKQGLLSPIDWRKFNIETAPGIFIENAKDALPLFTPAVQTALTKVYDIVEPWALPGEMPGPEDNLLNYGVPYFLQDFILGYKGELVADMSGNIPGSWKDVIDYFSKKVGSNLLYNKIALIDDYRSIYSIPRIIETIELSKGVNVNPPKGDKTTIAEFQKTYKYLTDKFPLNSFLLNSDSGTILNNFANPKGSDAGIMYNGDLLYAVQGGDEGYPLTPDKVHLVRPANTLIVLDMMVINKAKPNENLSYELIKKIALEGLNHEENITVKHNDEYVYGPMLNFDYVQYTSPLEKISNYVLSNDPAYTYFPYSDTEPWLQKLCQEIFNVVQTPSNSNMFESGLNDLEKSNMYQAFLREKGNF